MLRRSTRTAPLYAIALATMVLALFAAPAAAHKDGTGGKKAIGEVASFDGTTLTVTMNDGSSFAGTVADDVQIKVEHRGHKEHGKGHEKPSNGSPEDLAAGAKILRMKVKCDEVVKLRIRRAPATTTETDPVVTASEDLEGEVAAPETQVEDPDTTEEDDGCADEAEDSDGAILDDTTDVLDPVL